MIPPKVMRRAPGGTCWPAAAGLTGAWRAPGLAAVFCRPVQRVGGCAFPPVHPGPLWNSLGGEVGAAPATLACASLFTRGPPEPPEGFSPPAPAPPSPARGRGPETAEAGPENPGRLILQRRVKKLGALSARSLVEASPAGPPSEGWPRTAGCPVDLGGGPECFPLAGAARPSCSIRNLLRTTIGGLIGALP